MRKLPHIVNAWNEDVCTIIEKLRWIANIEEAAGLGTIEDMARRVLEDAENNPERVRWIANQLRLHGAQATRDQTGPPPKPQQTIQGQVEPIPLEGEAVTTSVAIQRL